MSSERSHSARSNQGAWKGKVVLITGSSNGLGLEIAREFLQRGATVCLTARNSAGLETARNDLQQTLSAEDSTSQRISIHPVDVTSDQQVTQLFENVAGEHGRLDVLVNNVGRSTRSDISQATVAEFDDMMQVNFYTTVRCTQSALPSIVKSDGHVVNIGSLASKTAWPYIAPYAASKHAVANYTHQLRLDGPKNVHFLLVCPGPIRREDSGERYAEQASGLPESAAQPGAGVKIKGLSAQSLARKIVTACEKRKPELVMPLKSRLLFVAQQFSVRLGDWLIGKFSKNK